VVSNRRERRALIAVAAGAVLLTGCSSTQEPEVGEVARAFEDPSGDAELRCDLLAPATRVAFEKSESTPCAEAVKDLPLQGGAVESIEIFGGDAQVKLAGDTVFLTETSAGWRITAAACRPKGEAPYDCEVDGP
jgi:hypothetical protein